MNIQTINEYIDLTKKKRELKDELENLNADLRQMEETLL